MNNYQLKTQYEILNTQYSRRGVSLIEIMIVIAIIGVVGIGIYMFLINMTRGWALAQAKMSLQHSAASVTHWLEHDFRNARRSTFNNRLNNLSFEVDDNGDGEPDDWQVWAERLPLPGVMEYVPPANYNAQGITYVTNSAGVSHSGRDYVQISSTLNGRVYEWRSAVIRFTPGRSAVTFGGWSRFVGIVQALTGGAVSGQWRIGAWINDDTNTDYFANTLTYPVFQTGRTDFEANAITNPWAARWQHMERTVTSNDIGGAPITSIQVWARYSDESNNIRAVWFDDLYARPWAANGAIVNTTMGITNDSMRLQDTFDGREVTIWRNATVFMRRDARGGIGRIGDCLTDAANNPSFTLVSFWEEAGEGVVDYGIDQVWADVEYERPWMNETIRWRSRSYLMPRVE